MICTTWRLGLHFLIWRVKGFRTRLFCGWLLALKSSVCNTIVEEMNKVGKGKYKSMKAANLLGFLEPWLPVSSFTGVWIHPFIFLLTAPWVPASLFSPTTSGNPLVNLGHFQHRCCGEGPGARMLCGCVFPPSSGSFPWTLEGVGLMTCVGFSVGDSAVLLWIILPRD